MRILMINPNSDPETTNCLQKKSDMFTDGKVKVDVVGLKNTPPKIATIADQGKALPEMMELIQAPQYDAFIVACHADPNLDLMKEMTDKPVIGIAEASMTFAARAGNGFAVITPSAKYISRKYALARKYHCDDLLRVIQVSDSADQDDLLRASRKALETPSIDSIVLGCANYALADRYIEQQLGVPVFEGAASSLIVAIGLARYRQL